MRGPHLKQGLDRKGNPIAAVAAVVEPVFVIKAIRLLAH
jgi:hypothetical protein